MGGGKSSGRKIWRSINKVVDPLNIMDPVGVLPTSWMAGKKPFRFDKGYGKLQWNLGGGSGGDSGKSGYDSNAAMMQYMSQMQANRALQAKAAQEAQKQALIQSQQKLAASSARQGETAAQQSLSQIGGMQQAKDIAALQSQKQSQQVAGTSAIGEGFDINQAQPQFTGTLPIDIKKSPYYEYDSTKQQQGLTNANLYNLPQTNAVKFGGT